MRRVGKVNKYGKYIISIIWLITIIVYPALISIYVTMPLFIGFVGLIFTRGLEENRFILTFFAFIYMTLLEINLSLPILLIAIATLTCYMFITSKLSILKSCPKCIDVITVISINFIYFFMLSFLDIFTSESSIEYNIAILYSIVFDILTVFLI